MNRNDNSNSTAAAVATEGSGNIGLVISTTETIRSFLMTASTDPNLPQDLRDLASSLSPHSSLSYKSLKSIWIGFDPKTRPSLFRLFSGSNFIFTSPKPREKSEELKARLRKLAEVAEKKEYEELVKDITPKKGVEEPFSSYKDQLGLGPSDQYAEITPCSQKKKDCVWCIFQNLVNFRKNLKKECKAMARWRVEGFLHK